MAIENRRNLWIGLGIVAFLFVDAVLIGVALSPRTANDAAIQAPLQLPAAATLTPSATPAELAPSSTPTTSPPPSAIPSATASTSATIPPPSTAADLRYLSVTSNGVGYRATKGSCQGPTSVIEKTADGGATWQKVNLGSIDVRMVDSITVVDGSQVNLLARLDAACTSTAVQSFTSGQYWQAYPERTSSFTSAPLPTASRAPGAYAVASSGGRTTVAAFGVSGCPGAAIETTPSLDSTAAPALLGCVAQITQPTPLALAVNGSTLWLWASGSTFVSADKGATWTLAST